MTQSPHNTTARGMTLMEILVVMLVISVVMAVVVVNVGGVFQARIGTAAGRLATLSRYAYQQATLHGEIFRLMLDLENGEYGLEKVVPPPRCGDLGEGFKEDERGFGAATRDTDGDDPTEITGQSFQDRHSRRGRLHKSLRFSQVMAGRQSEPVKEGMAYVHFFPNGVSEKAYIWLTDEEITFTLEIRSLTGGGRIHRENLDPREFRRR